MFLTQPETFVEQLCRMLDEAPQVIRIIIDCYLALIVITAVVYTAIKYKKALNLFIVGLLLLSIYFVSSWLDFEISKAIYGAILPSYIVICFILLAPELRRSMEYHKKEDLKKTEMMLTPTQATKDAICDAVFDMSSEKVGALITIELQMSLDQYAERAITLNSDISKELLEQIFIKDSPLHDGGVIIRGNKIICAAAYYTLTEDQSLDKTVGSRHRAGVGISELTDSVTIIVSEETGDVHVATSGFMKPMESKAELADYLNMTLN